MLLKLKDISCADAQALGNKNNYLVKLKVFDL